MVIGRIWTVMMTGHKTPSAPLGAYHGLSVSNECPKHLDSHVEGKFGAGHDPSSVRKECLERVSLMSICPCLSIDKLWLCLPVCWLRINWSIFTPIGSGHHPTINGSSTRLNMLRVIVYRPLNTVRLGFQEIQIER